MDDLLLITTQPAYAGQAEAESRFSMTELCKTQGVIPNTIFKSKMILKQLGLR
jgi:hypothetical protein